MKTEKKMHPITFGINKLSNCEHLFLLMLKKTPISVSNCFKRNEKLKWKAIVCKNGVFGKNYRTAGTCKTFNTATTIC